MSSTDRIDIDKPLWDLSTFSGRVRHFAWVTDPRTCIESDKELNEAKVLVDLYRKGQEPKGVTREQIIYAKKLYESAFHPDTGEKQNIAGRMSFQVPGGMAITGAMLQFYRTVPQVVFWQWVNQSFNALVNYTNRNANSPLTTTQLGVAYVSATASAMVTAFGFNKMLANAPPILQRYVPFAAVAAANCVNIPLMRQTEILYGVDLNDENGNLVVAKSKYAAAKGISQVVLSRIIMCAPGMLVLPVIMERLEKFPWMHKIKILHMPIQVLGVGCFLTFMVPIACAIFPQTCSISTATLERFEPEEYAKLKKQYDGKELPQFLYFNKGL
ncbi:sideroflexin-2-like isoform X2 [Chrysoperla carnea]|nr:sideroflexin-2-like isoform X2 [Chrysoperla carnea]